MAREIPVVNAWDLPPVEQARAAHAVAGDDHSAQSNQALVLEITNKLQPKVDALIEEFANTRPDVAPALLMEAMLNAVHRSLGHKIADDNQKHHTTSATTSSDDQPRKLVRGYVDGCFDLMHSGHYNAIRQAKQLCDVLVVGIHTDEEITKHKGPPVMNNEQRLSTVKSCKWADEICFGAPYVPSVALLDQLNCDFVVHGDDMAVGADGVDAYAEVKQAGRMRIVKRTAGVSTTDLVGRLLLMTKEHHLPSPAIKPASASSADAPADLSLGAAASKEVVSAPTASATASGATPRHYAEGVSNFLPTTWRISQFANHRTPGPEDTVVYIDGSFDLFHAGDIETLKRARALGHFLYVGIHDDQAVNRYSGVNYPIMNLHERVLSVLSSRYVDEVVIGAPLKVTDDMLKTLNIKIVVPSHKPLDLGFDPYAVPRSKGMLQEIDYSGLLSTSDVVEHIIHNRLKYEKRNANKEKKDLEYLKTKTYVAEI